MSAQQGEPTGRPGRYQRSAVGLVVSLLVTGAIVGGLVVVMGLFRHDFQAEPEDVDYLATVRGAQQSGLRPVYPPALPDGWIATGVEVDAGDAAAFGLRMLTDEEKFVGVRQEVASSTALLTRWVDEDVEPGEDYEVPPAVERPVARYWAGYTDRGGDTAYVSKVGDDTVIVFGSAPAEDLRAIIDSLVLGPVR